MVKAAIIEIDSFTEYTYIYEEKDYYYLLLPKSDFICSKLISENAIIEIDFVKYKFSKEIIRSSNTIDKYNKYLKVDQNDLLLFKIKLEKGQS